MITFISLFFPAVFTLWLYELLTKTSLRLKNAIMRYCSYVLFINFGCFGIKKFFLHTANSPLLFNGDMLPTVAFNYIVIALGVAMVLLVIEILFSKNIKINIEEEDFEKAQKN